MSGKRLRKEEKEAIVRDIRAKKKSFQQISRDHSVSISTVSRFAAELGLASPRKKTKPAGVPEHSYDRARRISALDRMVLSIEQMVSNGGLSSRQLKDLAGAAQSVFATRRAEDIEPEPEPQKADQTVWLEEFATENSPGIGLNPNTEIGREMLEFKQQIDAGIDPFKQRWAEEKAQREQERAEEEAENGVGRA
jgi:transposase-like protein